jgi:hypothetical protein
MFAYSGRKSDHRPSPLADTPKPSFMIGTTLFHYEFRAVLAGAAIISEGGKVESKV